MNHLIISHSVENPMLHKENNELKKRMGELEDDLNFYKSPFRTHRNSVIFNLHCKFINKKRVWIDRICARNEEILQLDRDDEVEEWLAPVRCDR